MSKTETKNEPSSGKAGFGERTYEREVILHEENGILESMEFLSMDSSDVRLNEDLRSKGVARI